MFFFFLRVFVPSWLKSSVNLPALYPRRRQEYRYGHAPAIGINRVSEMSPPFTDAER